MKSKGYYNRILAVVMAGLVSMSGIVGSSMCVFAAEADQVAETQVIESVIETENVTEDDTPVSDLPGENTEQEEPVAPDEEQNTDDAVPAGEDGTESSEPAPSENESGEPAPSEDTSDGSTEEEEIPSESSEPAQEEEKPGQDTPKETDNSAEEDVQETDTNSSEEVSWSANSDGITVNAKAKAGVLPDGAELKADRIYSGSVGETLDDHGTDYDGYAAFDVYFVKDGENIEPSGDVTITFDLHDVVPSDAEEVSVKHFDESNDTLDVVTVADTGNASDGDVSVSGSATKAEFEVSSFSTFAIVWKHGESEGWPESTYLTVNCKDQHGNLLTDDFVPDLVVLNNATSYKFEFSADNEKLKIGSVGSGTTAITYTFTSAEASVKGTNISGLKSIEASYSKTSGWTYAVSYMDGELEKTMSGLSAEDISLVLYYSNEDTSVSFSLNGGTGTTPETVTGKGGTKIILPDPEDYGISYDGYTFLGWSEAKNLKQDTSYHEVLKAGSEYYMPASGSKTLYAAWTSTTYGNVQFYIRLDAKVAPEPTQYGNALYTAGIYIAKTAKEQRWMIDMDASSHDGVHVQNAISENMETLPTAAQLKTVINGKSSSIGFTVDVDSDGKLYVASVSNENNEIGATKDDRLYVHWYVQKWANSNGTFWNVDGVLLTEKSIEVTYHGNPNGTDVSNLPAGYQITPGTDVTVGVTGAPSADTSHNLLYTSKTGYELVGWNTKADGTGTTYKVGDTFRPTKDTTLYAMWSKIPRGSLKITKQVAGASYADPDKEYRIRVSINAAWVNGAEAATKFESIEDTTGSVIGSNIFTDEWTDSEGNTWKSFSISLKDSQSVLISGLYDNTIFKIDELESGYEISYDGYDEETLSNNRIETNVTKNVVLRNNINVVETGVRTNNIPAIAWVLTVMFGCIAVFAYRTLKQRV